MLDLGSVAGEVLREQAGRATLFDGEPDVGRRALLAFLKAHRDAVDTPVAVFIAYAAKRYVALVQQANVAAIYRVRNDLQLKRMRRIPEPVAFAAELFRRQTAG